MAFERGPDLVRDVAAVGFDAIYVDRRGYLDNAEALMRELDDTVGAPVQRSADDRLLVWDIRANRAKLQADLGADGVKTLRDGILATVPLDYGKGFYGEENDGIELWRWANANAELTLTNEHSGPMSVHLRFEIQAVAPSQLRVTGPDVDLDIPVTTQPTPVDVPLVLRHGTTTLRLASTAPGSPTATAAIYGSASSTPPPAPKPARDGNSGRYGRMNSDLVKERFTGSGWTHPPQHALVAVEHDGPGVPALDVGPAGLAHGVAQRR